MYLWLWIVVAVVWLWLCGSTAFAWRQRRLGGFWTFCALGAWTGLGGLALLFVAPYWFVVWCVFIQPG